MEVLLGSNAKAYRNTGTYATPTWSEIDIIRDLDLNLEGVEWNANVRANVPWAADVVPLLRATVEGEILHSPSDLNYQAIRTAFLNRSALDLAIMDGDITTAGNEGLRAFFGVFNFSRTEHLEEGQVNGVRFKPTIADEAPVWMVVP